MFFLSSTFIFFLSIYDRSQKNMASVALSLIHSLVCLLFEVHSKQMKTWQTKKKTPLLLYFFFPKRLHYCCQNKDYMLNFLSLE
jgi:hypothetical protein